MTWILLVMLTTQVWRIESANPYASQPWDVYTSEIPNFSQWNSVNHQHLRFYAISNKKSRQTDFDNRFLAPFHVYIGLSVYLCLHSPSVLFRSFLSPRRHFHPPAVAGGAVTCATEERKTEQFLSINIVFVGFIQDISGRVPFISAFNLERPQGILPCYGNFGDDNTGR